MKSIWQKVESILNNFKLDKVISDARRITENSRTLIDVFITSNKKRIKETGVIYYGISHHIIIYAVHNMVLEKKPPIIKALKSLRNIDHNDLNRDMEKAPCMQGFRRRGSRGAMPPPFFVNYAFPKLVKDFLNSL